MNFNFRSSCTSTLLWSYARRAHPTWGRVLNTWTCAYAEVQRIRLDQAQWNRTLPVQRKLQRRISSTSWIGSMSRINCLQPMDNRSTHETSNEMWCGVGAAWWCNTVPAPYHTQHFTSPANLCFQQYQDTPVQIRKIQGRRSRESASASEYTWRQNDESEKLIEKEERGCVLFNGVVIRCPAQHKLSLVPKVKVDPPSLCFLFTKQARTKSKPERQETRERDWIGCRVWSGAALLETRLD